MNIFFLDYDPTIAARMLVDTNPMRARKMIVETMQIISTIKPQMHALLSAKRKTQISTSALIVKEVCEHTGFMYAPAYITHRCMTHQYNAESVAWLCVHLAALLKYSTYKDDGYTVPNKFCNHVFDKPLIACELAAQIKTVQWCGAICLPDCARNSLLGIDKRLELETQSERLIRLYREYLWIRENLVSFTPFVRIANKKQNADRTNKVGILAEAYVEARFTDVLLGHAVHEKPGEWLYNMLNKHTTWMRGL